MRTGEFEVQNTTTLVAGFQTATRRPVIIGAGVAAMLLCAMSFQMGSRRNLLRDNTVSAEQAMRGGADTAFKPVNSPVYGLSTVEVVLSNDGELTVDGKKLHGSRFHDLQLTAGMHTMVAHLGDKIMTEKFRTGADESLRFEFQKSRVRIFREVAAAE